MPDAVPQTSLPGEINVATRSLHTNLNRLITSRLPLALPPYASDPSQYTTGLLHFSHVFFTFESLWADLSSSSSEPASSPLLSFLLVNPYDCPELFTSPPSPEMLHFLISLRPKGLARSSRLKKDLEFLTGLHPTDLSVLLAQYPGDKVEEFCTHMRRTISHKPHTLVAYAWCFYMAVFSGGRWIRSQLTASGDDFWHTSTSDDSDSQKDSSSPLSERGLSLWSFEGLYDGEDIKAAFKNNLAAAEELFTMDERVEIIEEAKKIFTFCASLVGELDAKIGTDLQRIAHLERSDKKNGEEKKEKENYAIVSNAPKSPVGWLTKPEVTGTIVALGCLACVALLHLDIPGSWL